MKTSHEEKRQQVWLAAYTSALNSNRNHDHVEMADQAVERFDERFPKIMKVDFEKPEKPKRDKAAEKMFLDSHNVLLKIRNHIAPNTPLNNELFVEVKNNLKDLKDYISFLGKIKALFPNMSDDLLLMTIKNNLESNFKLMQIEKNYDIIEQQNSLWCIPKESTPVKIIPERDTYLPPEHPNGDDLTPKEGSDISCYDPDCFSKSCSPECENLKCNNSKATED